MSSVLLSVRTAGMLLRRSTASTNPCLFHSPRRMAHNIRVILTDDLPNGKAYKGEVLTVKAGYARNNLIPKKIALYATPENFERLGMEDPDHETPEQTAARLEREALSEEGAEELKSADFLRYYLRNKVLKIWRRVDPETQEVSPGMVDAKAVREKLSKQLMIDLEKHEKIHLSDEPLEPEDMTVEKTQAKAEAIDAEKQCDLQIRRLGNFVARITLAGDYVVPLKVAIMRAPHS